MVNKARLIENMADLVKEKRIEGITGLNDAKTIYNVLGGFYGYYITMFRRISVHKVEKSSLTFLSSSTVLNS